MKTNVFDGTHVHVMERMCATCIFRPGNLMHLEEGRVEQMVKDATKEEGVIPCHSTIHGSRDQEAVCKGFFDFHPTRLLQVAGRLGYVVFDPVDPSP